MAINTAPANDFAQAPLADVSVASDLTPHSSRYTVPEAHDLDPREIEIIVDLDLDEMLLYYYGRDVPHDVEPVGEMVSYLVESGSDRVVGAIIHEFMSRAVREHPSLSQAMRWAIIVSGDKIQAPLPEEADAGASASGYLQPWNRLRQSLMRRLVDEGRERTAETVQALLRTA